MKQPYDVIKIDKYTNKIQLPNLLLMTRSFDIIGKIGDYTDWNISLVGNGVDEITFHVNKYTNGNLCPVWDELIDLKIVEVMGFGYFEISVDYTDNTQTVKSVHGLSLETELAQISLYEFHVNDDDATTANDFIPTVFYNPDDKAHSLLHRVLADKAPHWKIGYVTPYLALSEEDQPEDVRKFQRTYTCDGTTIYDFLTGDVAKESNVIFTFDVIKNQETGKPERTINCYSLCDCIDQETGKVIIDGNGNQVTGIGEDTLVFISKNKLANEITISSNKDNVKNCFRIEGGDDVITDMVRVVNMNGSNYIYQFADFQYKDMPNELVKAIQTYHEELSKESDTYYGENGIYTRLCKAYDNLAYYESSMMPDVSIKETTAEEQYNIMINELTSPDMFVGVSSLGNYNNNLFVGVSNNIEAMANVLIDARYKAEVIKDSASYNSTSHTWTGNIRITRAADETDYYPKTEEQISACFTVKIDDDELTFTRQKIEKALHKSSMLDIDFEIANMNDEEIREYFNLYSLNRLKSFYDGYNSCLSILMQLDAKSSVREEMYNKYYSRMRIISNPSTEENPNPVPGVLDIRQEQVDKIKEDIDTIIKEQNKFQEDWNFQSCLGEDLYKIFCSYRREDTYTNSNYISDGLSTSKCLAKAKELVEAAAAEAKKACVLQRIVSTSLNNLFALPEFEPLYDKFALFNYIRIRTEDEILKLRLIGVEFSGDTVESIHVTFSEQIESIDGKLSDLQSIIQQAKSMSASFPSTVLQAKKGEKAQHTVEDMYTNGLNAAKSMLTNNDDNEVTITPSGIICKRMDDEGYYGEKQLRLTGNIMAFTKDNWNTVSMAIGETEFENPAKAEGNDKVKAYGIIAEAVVGKMIAGENMYIVNESGSVQITGDGIDITNGSLCVGDDNYSIEIDPKHRITEDGYLFCIKDKKDNSDDSVIMGVDTEGNGYFKGSIVSSSGSISGLTITENSLETEHLKIKSNGNHTQLLIQNAGTAFFNAESYYGAERRWNHVTMIDLDEFNLNASDINLHGELCINNENLSDMFLAKNPASLELYHTTPFIDFHHNYSTADYTQRIIADTANTLNIIAPGGIKENGTLLSDKYTKLSLLGECQFHAIQQYSVTSEITESNKQVTAIKGVNLFPGYDNIIMPICTMFGTVESIALHENTSGTNGEVEIVMRNVVNNSHKLTCNFYIISFKSITG